MFKNLPYENRPRGIMHWFDFRCRVCNAKYKIELDVNWSPRSRTWCPKCASQDVENVIEKVGLNAPIASRI